MEWISAFTKTLSSVWLTLQLLERAFAEKLPFEALKERCKAMLWAKFNNI